MRTRAVLAAGGLLLAGVTTPSVAAPARLVVSGTGMTYADVTIRERTVLSWDNFDKPHDWLTASFKGDYAGFVIESGDAAHRVMGGGVLVRDRQSRLGSGHARPVLIGRQDAAPDTMTLKPGRYRIVLVSDGHAEVRVRMTTGRSVQVTTRRRASGIVAQRYDLADLAPVGPVSVGNTRVPFTMTAKGLVVGSFFSSPGDDAYTYVALCLRRRTETETPCDEGWYIEPGSSITTSTDGRRDGKSLAPGEYVFDYTETITGPTVASGNAFVVTFTDAD